MSRRREPETVAVPCIARLPRGVAAVEPPTRAASLHEIDARKCPLFLLTGEYDYSCHPDDTREAARRIGVEATIMPGLGHFPMSEDPPTFRKHLMPVLEKIRALS